MLRCLWGVRASVLACGLILSTDLPAQEELSQDRLATKQTAEQKAATADKDVEFFEKKIRPLFAKHCYKCHGPKKQESDLRLDTVAGIAKGGGSGPLFEAGEPDQSLLISVIKYEEEDLQMPPEEMMSEDEIALFVEWVERGAPLPESKQKTRPRGIDLSEARKFWSLRPIADVQPPAVREQSWVRNEIDAFILARLESQGLQPARPASKRSLLRRATFDLTGLPPTPREIEDFLNDDSPQAFAQVVDRLLASSAYGERWGRYWLDVVRYADSNGLDENIAHGNAWRYRDYVIASLNRDKPYGQFLREQLAGDLLPAADREQRHERLIATGFLSLGPKVLAEVDERKMEMDIVDEQVDTVGRAFMAMTLGCARCHDHKFDPLTNADYYALAGIFKSTRTMEHFKKIARWNENPIPSPTDEQRLAEHQQQVEQLKGKISALVASSNQQLQATSADGKLPAKPEEKYDAETKKQLDQLRAALKKTEAASPKLPAAMGVSEGTVADTPIHRRGSHLTLGPVVPRGVPQVLAYQPVSIAPEQSGRRQLADWLATAEHPLTSRVMVNRIWRWHFGRGLVASTDNFGLLGDRPTHPQLLDWLAKRFANGSLKDMHRLIMLSSTYQMSGEFDAVAAAKDAENRLLWRFPLRRLEAEAIRDSLLAVSGLLDRSMGGSMLHVENRAFLFDHTSKDETNYDSDRRSVYLPIIRNHLYEVFLLFDYSDASVVNGSRSSTTIAPQALFMMNSDFVARVARTMAEQMEQVVGGDQQRLQRLYKQCYGREPTKAELASNLKFLERFVGTAAGDRRQAWTALIQAILSANEFVYVR